MSYNYNVRIEVPASQAEVAAKIGMALDPDGGGASSWNRTVINHDSEGNPVYGDTIFVSTPCRKEFFDQVPILIANPAMLHAVVAKDFADHWQGETPPTLPEIEAFCASVIPEPAVTTPESA